MLVTLIQDRIGNVIVRPVNRRTMDRMARDIERNGGSGDGSLFIQQPSVADVLELFGRRAIAKGEVNDGATLRIDAGEFRSMLGYCEA